MIKWETIIDFADRGYVRFFTDIAVKPDVEECDCTDSIEFTRNIENNIINDRDLKSEIDVLDDGERCICIPFDIEAIIVDNDKIKEELTAEAGTILRSIPIFVRRLPRYN